MHCYLTTLIWKKIHKHFQKNVQNFSSGVIKTRKYILRIYNTYNASLGIQSSPVILTTLYTNLTHSRDSNEFPKILSRLVQEFMSFNQIYKLTNRDYFFILKSYKNI